MKKTILNIAAIVAIATTSFIACDKKATDAAPAADSTAVAGDSAAAPAEVAPAADSTAVKADSAHADAAKAEAAPAKAEETK
ncbi:hypothetical protein O2K51_12695 [Apibacter raozihei]|uniref:hypothetical protein n=1 Tax=Apibacter TaxID=1778601 RepID=UPI0013E2D415|nr:MULTISPECIES: hypothetical protein [Apibacter]